eukprot:CAMPEP_0197692420 /NCGR_PEP_ID=MMETSP1338-20131121/111055_1 /TAXON_ID=43686 ORGANISM="Pelagodinium beii, Strain RCC1491" /NCGR_SAMPLE_ID=MMETSP1338 /ASSEMBLY_ACC=CAM_ASM_000754 /LENGTH=80 /DNA_ID=CAMNT_0043275079 /DNA_START=1 /DNA_END=240 /DNA_ORIENTATION=+
MVAKPDQVGVEEFVGQSLSQKPTKRVSRTSVKSGGSNSKRQVKLQGVMAEAEDQEEHADEHEEKMIHLKKKGGAMGGIDS